MIFSSGRGQTRCRGSSPFVHDGFKGEPTVHVHHCRYARRSAVMLTVRTTPSCGDRRSGDRAVFRQRRAPFRRIRFLFSRLDLFAAFLRVFRELCPLTILHDPRRNLYTPMIIYFQIRLIRIFFLFLYRAEPVFSPPLPSCRTAFCRGKALSPSWRFCRRNISRAALSYIPVFR